MEQEVARKSFSITSDRLVESAEGRPLDRRQMFIEQNTLTPNDENAGADIRSGACEGIRHALQSCQWQVDNGNGAVLAAQAELNRLPLKFENTLAQLPKARAAAQAAIKRMTPYSLDD